AVFGRRDGDAHESSFQRGLSDDIDVNAIRRFSELIETAGDLLPIGELVILTNTKPEIILRRLHLRRCSDTAEENRHQREPDRPRSHTRTLTVAAVCDRRGSLS